MKKFSFLILILVVGSAAFSQTEAEKELLSKWYSATEHQVEAYQIVALIDSINFRPVLRMKNLTTKSIKSVILALNVDAIKQINITGWYYCSEKYEDCYRLWNLNYPIVSQNVWFDNCIGLIALMTLDGFIK